MKLWLRKSTIEWLGRKANGRPIPTYLAEQLERQAETGLKNDRMVTARFKKDTKK